MPFHTCSAAAQSKEPDKHSHRQGAMAILIKLWFLLSNPTRNHPQMKLSCPIGGLTQTKLSARLVTELFRQIFSNTLHSVEASFPPQASPKAS